MRRAGSQCRAIAEAVAFIDKAPKGNNPLEYIFGDLLGTFPSGKTAALAALTYITQHAKLLWIAQMADLPERAAETALTLSPCNMVDSTTMKVSACWMSNGLSSPPRYHAC